MKIEKTKINSSKGSLSATIRYSETNKLAILCPGYLDSREYKHLTGLAEALNKQGYTSVVFDPTGTWESDGDISDYTTTQYLADIKAVLNHMLNQSHYKEILLGGHSRGGQVAILYAAQDHRISAVLGIMPSSGGEIEEKLRKEWQKNGVRISFRDIPSNKKKQKEFRVPFSYASDSEKHYVIKDVKKIKVPIILIAGELDNLVLPEDVKEIFDNANEPKKFIIVPNIGHDYRHNDSEIAIINKIIIEEVKRL